MTTLSPSDIAFITFNAVPRRNTTLKYSQLGPLGVRNHRAYCARHGYRFIDGVPIAAERPACWAKIPALLAAFATHRWVVWADSDTFILDPSRPLQAFLDDSCDMIVQSPRNWFDFIGLDAALGLQIQAVNTGVVIMRASDWSRALLRSAYAREEFISKHEIWNGVGEQEAINALLERGAVDRTPIKYVDDLQAPPRLMRPATMFVHFYGNYASHRYPQAACATVLDTWAATINDGRPGPAALAGVHWSAIQNNDADAVVDRGGPRKFGYDPDALDRWMAAQAAAAIAAAPVCG